MTLPRRAAHERFASTARRQTSSTSATASFDAGIASTRKRNQQPIIIGLCAVGNQFGIGETTVAVYSLTDSPTHQSPSLPILSIPPVLPPMMRKEGTAPGRGWHFLRPLVAEWLGGDPE